MINYQEKYEALLSAIKKANECHEYGTDCPITVYMDDCPEYDLLQSALNSND